MADAASRDQGGRGGDREGESVSVISTRVIGARGNARNGHVGARGDGSGELTTDATNEKRARVTASWAIRGVAGLLGGGLAAFGFQDR